MKKILLLFIVCLTFTAIASSVFIINPVSAHNECDPQRPNSCNNDNKKCVNAHQGKDGKQGHCEDENSGGSNPPPGGPPPPPAGPPPEPQSYPDPNVQIVSQMPPLDIVFIMDNSTSVKDEMPTMKASARAMVRLLARNPRTRFALGTFDNNGGIVGGTNFVGQGTMLDHITNVKVKGDNGTCLECAVDGRGGDDAYGVFNQNPYPSTGRQRRVLIILTDGNINRWIRDDGSIGGDGNPENDKPDDQTARNQAEAAISRIHNRLQAELWVLHYGVSGNHQAWLQSLTRKFNPKFGELAYHWEGHIRYSNGVPFDSKLEGAFLEAGRKLLGGKIDIKVFHDTHRVKRCQEDPTISCNGNTCQTKPTLGCLVRGQDGTLNWVDYNGSGKFDPGEEYEVGLAGFQVTLSRDYGLIDYWNWWQMNRINTPRSYSITTKTDPLGHAVFENIPAFETPELFRISIQKPVGTDYDFVSSGNYFTSIGRADLETSNPDTVYVMAPETPPYYDIDHPWFDYGFISVTPTPTPRPPFANFSGEVFVDNNRNMIRDSEDLRYQSSLNIGLYTGVGQIQNKPINTGDGRYAFDAVAAGNYSIRLPLPTGYEMTFPPQPLYLVGVVDAGTCTITPDRTADGQTFVCNDGDITNLNFGIRDIDAWIQTFGFNIRNDREPVESVIPATTACGDVLVRDTNGSPGVIYSAGDGKFGRGKASSTQWLVNNAPYAAGTNGLQTSYSGMNATLSQNKVTTGNLTTYSACSNLSSCTITDTIATGAYRVDDDVTLNSVTLTAGGQDKILLLVSGNVRIRGAIRVDPGAFFMIVSQGDITVDSALGRTSSYFCAHEGALTDMHLQGIFSTDGDFIIEGGSQCPASDRQLNISGSIVTNADGEGAGELINNRQLCAGDATHPSLTVRARPDFIFSAPPTILRTSTVWEEAAP